MSSYADIKFSCELFQNKKVNITYSGDLYKNNSDIVYIVFGFGDEWHHTTEKQMEKTENGFTVEINLLNYDKFNFCFKNSNYEWDNNNYQNYTSPISEEPQVEENFIINENIISGILTDLFEKNISEVDSKILPILDENEIVTKADENKKQETNQTENNIEFSIEVEKNEPVSIEDTIVNSVEEPELNNDIENIFNDIYNEDNSSKENTAENTTSTDTSKILTNILSENQSENIDVAEFDMDNLIDEILSPIVKSATFEEENVSSIENFKQENNETVDSEYDDNIDNSIDNLINDLFENAEKESKNAVLNINTEEVKQTENIVEQSNEINDIEKFQSTETELDLEAPLIDVLNKDELEKNEETSLIEVANQDDFLVSPRSLNKFYMFKKKIKLAFYKLFVAIPKILSSAFDEGKINK